MQDKLQLNLISEAGASPREGGMRRPMRGSCEHSQVRSPEMAGWGTVPRGALHCIKQCRGTHRVAPMRACWSASAYREAYSFTEGHGSSSHKAQKSLLAANVAIASGWPIGPNWWHGIGDGCGDHLSEADMAVKAGPVRRSAVEALLK